MAFDSTSGCYLEDDYGPIGKTEVNDISQFNTALDALKNALNGTDVDVCSTQMVYLQSILNGTADAGLANGDYLHSLVKQALLNANPGNKAVADYITRQLTDFYC